MCYTDQSEDHSTRPNKARNGTTLVCLQASATFFSGEELAESNTDDSHDKKCLDSTKLNSLKILVFTKFPVSNSEEKDKAWRFIKEKINSKCHASRKISMLDLTPPHSL